MRAREFLVKVTISDDDEINFEFPDEEEQPVTMFPQQQEMELLKASQGKKSSAIDQLTDNDQEE